MNVEAYRKTLRRRMIVMMIAGLAYVAAMLVMHVLRHGELSVTVSFLTGFACGATGLILAFVPRYRKALRDEQALRRMWNREHDERMSAIRARAGLPMLLYTSMAMIVAALLIAPWNITAAATLLLAATVQLAISTIVKLVCMRIM